MKTYSVTLPISGVIYIDNIEAESEEEAIEKAFNSDQLTIDNIGEWEAHKQIVRGNVFYGHTNEACAEEQ